VDYPRALLDGQSAGGDLWPALAWCLGLLVVAYAWAVGRTAGACADRVLTT
jgi:ABC-2 type transport system permease protein